MTRQPFAPIPSVPLVSSLWLLVARTVIRHRYQAARLHSHVQRVYVNARKQVCRRSVILSGVNGSVILSAPTGVMLN